MRGKKYRFLLCLLVFAVMLCAPAAAQQELPQILSKAYVVLDSATGQVLVGREQDTKMNPASITKVLTVALAMEKCALDETFIVGEGALDIDPQSTHIALTPGEEVTVEEMAYAAMLVSANDAANALAEHAGGTLEGFVGMMNAKAREVGAYNTRFANPNGLYDAGHFTTARDMALITSWALTVPRFREVFGASDYQMGPTNLQPQARPFETSNCLTVTSKFIYDGALGGKLGWTPESNHTIVSAAKRNGMELICVALDTKTKWEKFKDSVALYDYCYDNFHAVQIAPPPGPASAAVFEGGQQTASVLYEIPPSYTVILPKGQEAQSVRAEWSLPDRYEGVPQEEPEIHFYQGEKEILALPVAFTVQQAIPTAAKEEKEPFHLPAWTRWVAGTLLFIILFVLIVHRHMVVVRRRRRRRMLRRQRLSREL